MSLHDLLTGRSCGHSLKGHRVLVVEDDYLLAQDLREQLMCWGAEMIGPVTKVAEALAFLEAGSAPDMAILDIELNDTMVYPVAEVLRARGIPFVFATGYDALVIPEGYAGVPVAQKPMALRDAALAP